MEKELEERAEAYADEHWVTRYSNELAKYVYCKAATEQKAIDDARIENILADSKKILNGQKWYLIDKACRVHCSMCPVKCDIKDIRKATCTEIQTIISAMEELI